MQSKFFNVAGNLDMSLQNQANICQRVQTVHREYAERVLRFVRTFVQASVRQWLEQRHEARSSLRHVGRIGLCTKASCHITTLFCAVLDQTMFIYPIRRLPTIPAGPFVTRAPSARLTWP